MLGRSVGNSFTRLPLYARLPLRPASFQCTVSLQNRSYATPGRPRSTVGEPSRPVKRAVKRAAKAPASDDEAATQKVKERKKAAAKKPKTKANAKKAAPKKPKRRVLTPEQQEAKAALKVKKDIKELKKLALNPPSFRGVKVTAYNVFASEKLQEMKGQGTGREANKQHLADAARMWKEISPAALEHYNHLAHTRTEERTAEYKRWVESHTPEQITAANNARTQLRRKLKEKTKGTSKWTPIRDERQVKRPISPFAQFTTNRNASGDFRNIPIPERAKLIAKEWKALDESEKKKYMDLFSEDRSRYSEEYNHTYGHLPPTLNGGEPQAVPAVA